MTVSYIDRPHTWTEALPAGRGLRNPIDDLSLALTPSPEGMVPWSYYVPPFLARDKLLAPGYDALHALGERVDLKVLSSPLGTAADLGPTEPDADKLAHLVAESDLVVYSLGRAYPNSLLGDIMYALDGSAEMTQDEVSPELAASIGIYDRIQEALLQYGNAAGVRVDFGLLDRGNSMHGDEVPPAADRTLEEMYRRGMRGADGPFEELVVDMVMAKLRTLRNMGAVGLALKQFADINGDRLFDEASHIKMLYVTGTVGHYIFKGMRRNYRMKTRAIEAVEAARPLRHAAMILDSCIFDEEHDVPVLLGLQDPVQPT